MLYITTAETKDAFTAPYTLSNDYSPDGGAFVPYVLPSLCEEDHATWMNLSFSQTVAKVLNMFFPTQLSGWDVDFCIGRNAVKLFGMSRMLMLAELWHNPDASYSYAVGNLYRKMGFSDTRKNPSEWFCVAVRIAFCVGLYYEMIRNGELKSSEYFDICIGTDDFSAFSAALYAREMGLPIGKIICTCIGSGAIWDLIHRGIYNTASAEPAYKPGVERLILNRLGESELKRFKECFEKRRIYSVDEEQLAVLNDGLFCVVTGQERAKSTINSVYRSNGYLISPHTALYCGSIQDFRAKTGESRLSLLMIREDPGRYLKEISEATGVNPQKLLNRTE